MARLRGVCSACNVPWIAHPRSCYLRPAPGSGCTVVRGRCESNGVRALQKICWLTLGENLTPSEYLRRYSAQAPPHGPCPACDGSLDGHGKFLRLLMEEDGGEIRLPLYRCLCPNPDCPVVTVTLYPDFVTPYGRHETRIREGALRRHDEEQISWERTAELAGVSPDTVRRWDRDFRIRLPLLLAGLFFLCVSLDPDLPLAQVEDAPVWRTLDRIAGLLNRPFCGLRLALARDRLPVSLRAPPRWPVWT